MINDEKGKKKREYRNNIGKSKNKKNKVKREKKKKEKIMQYNLPTFLHN